VGAPANAAGLVGVIDARRGAERASGAPAAHAQSRASTSTRETRGEADDMACRLQVARCLRREHQNPCISFLTTNGAGVRTLRKARLNTSTSRMNHESNASVLSKHKKLAYTTALSYYKATSPHVT
jgi:hypothetical protein